MNEVNVDFVDITKKIYSLHPIQKAVSVEGAHKKIQLEKHGRETFVDCPGIFDYKSQGWIMTAWDEFTVYASEGATMAYAGSDGRPTDFPTPKPIHKTNPNPMSADITDGIPNDATECPVKRLQPLHFCSPWRVQPQNDISLLLMPPFYHSQYIMENFMIYPGIVDYTQKFHTINVIMSPKKEGTFVIKAGTPLLHMIPIQKGTYNLKYGPQTKEDIGVVASAKQFYRRYIMKRSKYTLEKFDD